MIGMRTLLSRRGEPRRRTRRVMVVAALVAIPLVPAALMVTRLADWPHPIGLLAIVLALFLFSIPLLALQEFRRNVIRRGLPDERERQRRDEAYRISYRIIELSPVLGLLMVIMFRDEMAAILSYDWFLIFFPIYGYLVFLPYAVFAWREPDVVD